MTARTIEVCDARAVSTASISGRVRDLAGVERSNTEITRVGLRGGGSEGAEEGPRRERHSAPSLLLLQRGKAFSFFPSRPLVCAFRFVDHTRMGINNETERTRCWSAPPAAQSRAWRLRWKPAPPASRRLYLRVVCMGARCGAAVLCEDGEGWERGTSSIVELTGHRSSQSRSSTLIVSQTERTVCRGHCRNEAAPCRKRAKKKKKKLLQSSRADVHNSKAPPRQVGAAIGERVISLKANATLARKQ